MRIVIEIPRLSEERTTFACTLLMDALVVIGLEAEKELGRVPPLYRSGVVFRPEPFTDGEHFDLPWIVIARGWGDCDDLSIWRRIELARKGEATLSRVVWRPDTRRYHAQVRRSDGTWEDPSLMLKR